ncbi:hypothetical protein EMCRGX_G021110 [Ephydatia muelleri]
MHQTQRLVALVAQQMQKLCSWCGGKLGHDTFIVRRANLIQTLYNVHISIVPPKVKIWTLVTATFYENRIIFVLLDLIALVGLSGVLHPLWSLKEYLVFTGVVATVSVLSGTVLCLFLYFVTQNMTIIFSNFHGLVGLVCGYIVAVKQFYPDSTLSPPPVPPTLRVKHVPLLVVLTYLLLSLCKVVSPTVCWLSLSGTLTAWTYLRFFQPREQGGRGDMTEEFAFATLLPEIVQPPVAAFSHALYNVLVATKLCPKAAQMYSMDEPSSIKITLPGMNPADAQRRQQRALKALDERLSKTEQAPPTWPSLEDNSQDEAGSSEPSSPHTTFEVKLETPGSVLKDQGVPASAKPTS